VAVIFEAEQLTYAELDERANALAAELQTYGVGPDVLVGISMERSIELVVALLAVLKAGGAYVPLDPSYPPERLRFMIEDAKPVVIVKDGQVVTTDYTDQIRGFDPRHPCNLAYVIYTSGSTGTPKGVAVTHANVVRLFNATEQWFDFNENDVWTLFHSYAFDFSVWELWGALLYGGRLVIVPYLVSREPGAFYELLSKEQVTVLNQTPSAFRQLMQAEPAEAAPLALRYVIFGGEALELQSLGPWFERHGDEQPLLVNMYGITETTVHVTYRPIRKTDLEKASGSVIGERIRDLQTYVLDAAQQPVPIGVAGELYVGGSGLARGYLQRPELTAERFVPHPWGEAGDRLYRTGDRGRYLANGELEYFGRVDRQVKVRGFRIELGEIEAVLAQHKDVRESVVIARDDDGDTRLIAYVVAGQEQVLTVSELHAHMKERLPEYMVPSAFVLLDKLPLTANGKVDRRALPAPTGSRPELTQDYVAPRTGVELAIATMWTAVLGVERVGIHDNFFELGGHSLLATQIVSRLRDTLKIELPLRHIFEYPTVHALAAKIDDAGELAPPIVPVLRDQPLPLSFAQQRLWFVDQLESGTSMYNLPAGYVLTGPLDVAALEQSLNEVLRRHTSLRTYFITSDDGTPAQLIAPAEPFTLPQLDLRELPDAEREIETRRLLAAEAAKPFELSRAPLLRCLLLRTADEEHVFILTIPHIVTDGWSMNVFQRELATLYGSYLEQKPSPLPELAVQYTDFAVWQRNWLRGEVFDRLLDYWRE
jgi:amino acid adenylation domain-containing protein